MYVKTFESDNFKNWVAVLDARTCRECKNIHGKIYYSHEQPYPEPPLHQRDRCKIKYLKAMYAGNATGRGIYGADWWLARHGELPDYYISKEEAEQQFEWDRKKANLHIVAPGMMIGGDVYKNSNGHLPQKPGRIWYEADINYKKGKRNRQRVVYSNDGLIFVTYDHYMTFIEIV